MAKPRARLVISVTYNPRAECKTEGCDVTWPHHPDTTQAAKDHAVREDHDVWVIREQVSEYVRAE